MIGWLIRWIVMTIAVMIVAKTYRGLNVIGWWDAFLSAVLLSLVNGDRSHSAQRSRRSNPAMRAMRSSSAGQTYRYGGLEAQHAIARDRVVV